MINLPSITKELNVLATDLLEGSHDLEGSEITLSRVGEDADLLREGTLGNALLQELLWKLFFEKHFRFKY